MAVVEGWGPLGGVKRCSGLTTWQPCPRRPGPVGTAVWTTRDAGVGSGLWSAEGAKCFSLACFDRVFLTIFQLKCTLR
jgi:hypothetical protein